MGLLLLVPIAARLLIPSVRRKASLPVLRFPHIEVLKNSFAAFTPGGAKTGRLFIILLSLLWICLVLALMRPQIVDRLTEVKNKGYDIMLAVDLSGSMRALDFSKGRDRVNRLDVAKEVVGNFVRDRKNDRIGLVLFGDHAYQYTPLTPDTAEVSKMLNDTVISMAGDGTAIGDAIGLAVKGLRDRPEKSRIIILLTDGEDTASSIPPLQAAKLAKEYGIRIYTIGIGSNGLVPYPDQYGRIIMVKTNLDEKLLKEIADITGGDYFRATDSSALHEIYAHINKMEKSKGITRQYLIRTPLYRYPLGAALVLLVLIVLLPVILQGVRRRQYGF
jgi:Ca-activated chloride channel family protein